MTKWDGMPIEVEFKGKRFTAFLSREAIEDLGRLKGNEPEDVWLGVFDKYRASILDGIRWPYSSEKNWDSKQGCLRFAGRYIRELQ